MILKVEVMEHIFVALLCKKIPLTFCGKDLFIWLFITIVNRHSYPVAIIFINYEKNIINSRFAARIYIVIFMA